ncbi:hotdog fold thioesterase [Xanthomonas albilineans]|nr:hotdog fold thioesterase [Xanthomonas albilineans]
MSANTMQALLGIRMIEIGSDYLVSCMSVDWRCHQPYGVLHGGASVTLAEATGSMAASMCVPAGQRCVGLDINANHIASISSGQVQCIARPLHIGALTQVWQMRIYDEGDRTICVSRLTMAVLSVHVARVSPNPASSGVQT